MAAGLTPELAALAATVLIHLAAVGWSQAALTRDVGPRGNMGPRDGDLPLSQQTLRLRRALANHVENTGLFLTAVVLVSLTGSNSWFTAACAWVYVAARALYLPGYAFGWVPGRSILFTIGLVATLAMVAAGVAGGV
ncbi:MAPEG family protein [Frigidibacter oleivorans]|uniref:MAPEG family protein n=1 Tax=Frigidibacter oleivorans TaxID=2487129 RepID=UPI002E25FA57